ncbi:MAG: helix-turn-helix domain-containing protein [Candidatus Limnocylindria bacterium]
MGDLRRAAGLSERAAARRLGTSQTQLRRMEDPRYLPSLRSLARLASIYGCELKVEFAQKVAGAQRAAPPKGKAAPRTRASASGSPSKGRAAAPRRGRAVAPGRARSAAPRRRS